MALPKVHTEYDPPPHDGLDCTTSTDMTQQHFGPECDINNIMKRYDMVEDSAYVPPMAGDFTQVPDFLEAQNIVIQARDQFASLPANIRGRFENDPAKFLAFVHDAKNQDEAVQLGLATPKPKAPKPTVQQVVVGTLDKDGNFVPQSSSPPAPLPPTQ